MVTVADIMTSGSQEAARKLLTPLSKSELVALCRGEADIPIGSKYSKGKIIDTVVYILVMVPQTSAVIAGRAKGY